jgi:hypothetical protein
MPCRKRQVRRDATCGQSCTSCKRAGIKCRSVHCVTSLRNITLKLLRPHPNQLQLSDIAEPEHDHPQLFPGINVPPQRLSSTLGSGNLSQFFESGILGSHWDRFEENGTFRTVYVGTDVANLHHLVRDNKLLRRSFLCYPFPAIRDELPWKPHAEMTWRVGNTYPLR